MFKAIVINKDESQYRVQTEQVDEAQLPEGDVLVQVMHSTMNYKDALAITGASPVVRSFPMVPGIDLAGRVASSQHPDFEPGDLVVLNGWGVGEVHWGGLAEKARLQGDWLIKLPSRFTTAQAMAIGTAGYTAMLCVMALEDHGVTPEKGPVLVTGAAGGVGSVALSVMSKLGYELVAATGRSEDADYLKYLGATHIIDRHELSSKGRPLAKERWAGAIDVVGSQTLANVCAGLKYGGTVAACGLAGGMDLPATVMPFILRGVTLAGVDSVMCPKERRIQAWERLAQDLDLEKLDRLTSEIPFSSVIGTAEQFLAGQVRGRLVVQLGN